MKAKKLSPGVYIYGNFQIVKVAKNFWRVTVDGNNNDFMTLSDAVYFCRNGGSLYPKYPK